MRKKSELAGLKNIGPTIEKRLNEVGIMTKADLGRVGAVQAYLKIKRKNAGKTVPMCYYLYSLEGALTDTHWDVLPAKTKKELLEKIS